MIGPLVYLVTSCDYTISNNDLALDMKSAVSIPFCGGIKNHVHYHLSILQEILLTYLFMGILDLSDFFLKNHIAWGYIKTHISWNVQNIRTYIMLKFPLSQKWYIKLEGLPWFTYYILTKTLENQLLMTHYKIFPFITECILVGSNISCSSED